MGPVFVQVPRLLLWSPRGFLSYLYTLPFWLFLLFFFRLRVFVYLGQDFHDGFFSYLPLDFCRDPSR